MNRALRLLPLTAVALLSACTSAAPTAQSAPTPTPTVLPACSALPTGDLPHSGGQLTQQQSGVYCLPKGQRLDIFLTAAKSGDTWTPVQSTSSVLAPTSTGVMTAPLGVTPAMFVGTTDGEAQLTSSAPSGATWKVTIVVKG